MKNKRPVVILTCCLAAVACVTRWRPLALGFILGGAFAALHQRLLEFRVDGILRQTRASMLLVLTGPLLGLAVLAAPLACAYFLPHVIAWQGVAAGLLAPKAILYVSALKGGPADE